MKAWATIILILFVHTGFAQQPIRVGAKHFNEGYILSEMIALLLEDGGYRVERKFNLGGTAVSFEALRTGAIDVYPEYTGTIAREILKAERIFSIDEIDHEVRSRYSLQISGSFGFNNTYGLVLTKELSEQYNLNKISDLSNRQNLKVGLSYEFIERQDGWNNLAVRYHLPQKITALEHGLAYQALREGKIDVTDAYSTDGEIEKYNLVLLNDDLHFFPDYQAVAFYSDQLPEGAVSILSKLIGLISESEMQKLNSQALFENKSHRTIAREFLIEKGFLKAGVNNERPAINQVLVKTWKHLLLTLTALLASLLFALPLGILTYRNPRVAEACLYITGILQTIPSIALLALMIPLFGIGVAPAIIALFLYALLPILRNSIIGLTTVDPVLKRVALALGMNRWNSLKRVELPLAMPTILAGIRTAAVINVGTATLAAFIGAGGLGEFIVTGLALNNTTLILMGAIPAALLAIITELLFEGVEKLVVPSHLRNGNIVE